VASTIFAERAPSATTISAASRLSLAIPILRTVQKKIDAAETAAKQEQLASETNA
jgi:hypothetical protein